MLTNKYIIGNIFFFCCCCLLALLSVKEQLGSNTILMWRPMSQRGNVVQRSALYDGYPMIKEIVSMQGVKGDISNLISLLTLEEIVCSGKDTHLQKNYHKSWTRVFGLKTLVQLTRGLKT